jgi:hypothetical protein
MLPYYCNPPAGFFRVKYVEEGNWDPRVHMRSEGESAAPKLLKIAIQVCLLRGLNPAMVV